MTRGWVRSVVGVATVLVVAAVLVLGGYGSEEARAQNTGVQNPDGTIATSGTRTVSPSGRMQLPTSSRPTEVSDARQREQEAAQARSHALTRYTTPEGPGAQHLTSPPTIPQSEAPRPRPAAPAPLLALATAWATGRSTGV